jgi:hypothetical protein
MIERMSVASRRSKISDTVLRVLNVVPRNSRFELVPKTRYYEDALCTTATHDFVDDPDFVRAYQRGVRAAGWDYRIRWRVYVALWVAAAGTRIPGDFVECGVGRGMVSSAVLESLPWADLGRRFLLVDTFLPYFPDADGRQGEDQGISQHYASDVEAVRANFAEWPDVCLIQGHIPEVLDTIDVEAVAYLHLDLNAAEAERAALRHFWPLLSSGGFVLLDDYGFGGEHRLQKRSADEFAAAANTRVLTLPTGQGILVK